MKNEKQLVKNIFSDTWQRLEKKGKTKEGITLYDDYSHHPTEIKASIEALREIYPIGKKKITIVFQPHLYSRTKALFNNFSTCFKGVDEIILLPIYFTQKDKNESVSSRGLAEAICQNEDKAIVFADFELAKKFLKNHKFGKNDVIIAMGAGEAFEVTDSVFSLM